MAGYIIYSLDWNQFRQLVEQPTPVQLSGLARLIAENLEENDGEFDASDPISKWPSDPKELARIAAERLKREDWYSDLTSAGKTLWESVIFHACMDCDEIKVGFEVEDDGVYWDVIDMAFKHFRVVPNQVSSVALSTFGTRPFRYRLKSASKTRDDFDREQQRNESSLKALGGLLQGFITSFKKKGNSDPDRLLTELDQQSDILDEHKKAIRDLMDDDLDDDVDDDDSSDWSPMHSMHEPNEVQKMLEELRSIEPAMMKSKKEDVREDFEHLLTAIEKIAGEGRMLFVQVDT